jgi:hypothetical protein
MSVENRYATRPGARPSVAYFEFRGSKQCKFDAFRLFLENDGRFRMPAGTRFLCRSYRDPENADGLFHHEVLMVYPLNVRFPLGLICGVKVAGDEAVLVRMESPGRGQSSTRFIRGKVGYLATVFPVEGAELTGDPLALVRASGSEVMSDRRSSGGEIGKQDGRESNEGSRSSDGSMSSVSISNSAVSCFGVDVSDVQTLEAAIAVREFEKRELCVEHARLILEIDQLVWHRNRANGWVCRPGSGGDPRCPLPFNSV